MLSSSIGTRYNQLLQQPGYRQPPLIAPSDAYKEELEKPSILERAYAADNPISAFGRAAGSTLPTLGKGILGVGKAGVELAGFESPAWIEEAMKQGDIEQQAFLSPYKGTDVSGRPQYVDPEKHPIATKAGLAAGSIAPFLTPWGAPIAGAGMVGGVYQGARERELTPLQSAGLGTVAGGALVASMGVGNWLAGRTAGAVAKKLGGITEDVVIPGVGKAVSVTPTGIASVANRAAQSVENVVLGAPVQAAFSYAEGRQGWDILKDIADPVNIMTDAIMGAAFPVKERISRKAPALQGELDPTLETAKNTKEAANTIATENKVDAAPVEKSAQDQMQTILQDEARGIKKTTFAAKDRQGELNVINAYLEGRVVDDAGTPIQMDEGQIKFMQTRKKNLEAELGIKPDDGPAAPSRETVRVAVEQALGEEAAARTVGMLEKKMLGVGMQADQAAAFTQYIYEPMRQVYTESARRGGATTPEQVVAMLDISAGGEDVVMATLYPEAFFGYDKEGNIIKKGPRSKLSNEVVERLGDPSVTTLAGLQRALRGTVRGAFAEDYITPGTASVAEFKASLGIVANRFISFLRGKQPPASDAVAHEFTHLISNLLQTVPGAFDDFYRAMGVDPELLYKRNRTPDERARVVAMEEKVARQVLATLATDRLSKAVPEHLKPHFDFITQELNKIYGTKGVLSRLFGGSVEWNILWEGKESSILGTFHEEYSAYMRPENRHMREREIARLFGVEPPQGQRNTYDVSLVPVGKVVDQIYEALPEDIREPVRLADTRFTPETGAESGAYDPYNKSYLAQRGNPFEQARQKGYREGFFKRGGKEYVGPGIGVERMRKGTDASEGLLRASRSLFGGALEKLPKERIREIFTGFSEHQVDLFDSIGGTKDVSELSGMIQNTIMTLMERASGWTEFAILDKRYRSGEWGKLDTPDGRAAADAKLEVERARVTEEIEVYKQALRSVGAYNAEIARSMATMQAHAMTKLISGIDGITQHMDTEARLKWGEDNYNLMQEAMDLCITGENPARLAQIQNQIQPVAVREFFQSYFIGNLLSGVHTNVVNVVSNAWWQAHERMTRKLERAGVAWREKGINPLRTLFWERSFAEALGESRERWGSGAKAFHRSFWYDENLGIRYETAKVSPWVRAGRQRVQQGKTGGALMMHLGAIHEMPLRLLRSFDAFFVESAAAAERQMQLQMQAILESPVGASAKNIRKKYYELQKTHMDELNSVAPAKWSKRTKDIEETSRNFGLRSVFADNDRLISTLTQIRDRWDYKPGIGREGEPGYKAPQNAGIGSAAASVAAHTLFPFIRVPATIARYGLAYSPVFSFMGRGGRLPESKGAYWIRQAEVYGTAAAMWLVHSQGYLTGAPPKDEGERKRQEDLGVQWWSVGIPDPRNPGGKYWVKYNNWGPAGYMLANMATQFQAIDKAWEDAQTINNGEIPEGDWEKMARKYVNTLGNMFDFYSDNTWVRGLDIVGGIGPDRKDPVSVMFNYAKGVGEGYIPWASFLRDMREAGEAVENSGALGGLLSYDPEGGFLAAKRDLTEQRFPLKIAGIQKEGFIPGSGKFLQPFVSTAKRVNVWGEKIQLPGGIMQDWFMPRWRYERKKDYIEKALDEAKYYPSYPDREIKLYGQKDPVEIPEEIYQDYAIFFGKRMKDELAKVIKSSKWRYADRTRGEEEKVQEKKKELLRHARDRAKASADRTLRMVMMRQVEREY